MSYEYITQDKKNLATVFFIPKEKDGSDYANVDEIIINGVTNNAVDYKSNYFAYLKKYEVTPQNIPYFVSSVDTRTNKLLYTLNIVRIPVTYYNSKKDIVNAINTTYAKSISEAFFKNYVDNSAYVSINGTDLNNYPLPEPFTLNMYGFKKNINLLGGNNKNLMDMIIGYDPSMLVYQGLLENAGPNETSIKTIDLSNNCENINLNFNFKNNDDVTYLNMVVKNNSYFSMMFKSMNNTNFNYQLEYYTNNDYLISPNESSYIKTYANDVISNFSVNNETISKSYSTTTNNGSGDSSTETTSSNNGGYYDNLIGFFDTNIDEAKTNINKTSFKYLSGIMCDMNDDETELYMYFYKNALRYKGEITVDEFNQSLEMLKLTLYPYNTASNLIYDRFTIINKSITVNVQYNNINYTLPSSSPINVTVDNITFITNNHSYDFTDVENFTINSGNIIITGNNITITGGKLNNIQNANITFENVDLSFVDNNTNYQYNNVILTLKNVNINVDSANSITITNNASFEVESGVGNLLASEGKIITNMDLTVSYLQLQNTNNETTSFINIGNYNSVDIDNIAINAVNDIAINTISGTNDSSDPIANVILANNGKLNIPGDNVDAASEHANTFSIKALNNKYFTIYSPNLNGDMITSYTVEGQQYASSFESNGDCTYISNISVNTDLNNYGYEADNIQISLNLDNVTGKTIINDNEATITNVDSATDNIQSGYLSSSTGTFNYTNATITNYNSTLSLYGDTTSNSVPCTPNITYTSNIGNDEINITTNQNISVMDIGDIMITNALKYIDGDDTNLYIGNISQINSNTRKGQITFVENTGTITPGAITLTSVEFENVKTSTSPTGETTIIGKPTIKIGGTSTNNNKATVTMGPITFTSPSTTLNTGQSKQDIYIRNLTFVQNNDSDSSSGGAATAESVFTGEDLLSIPSISRDIYKFNSNVPPLYRDSRKNLYYYNGSAFSVINIGETPIIAEKVDICGNIYVVQTSDNNLVFIGFQIDDTITAVISTTSIPAGNIWVANNEKTFILNSDNTLNAYNVSLSQGTITTSSIDNIPQPLYDVVNIYADAKYLFAVDEFNNFSYLNFNDSQPSWTMIEDNNLSIYNCVLSTIFLDSTGKMKYISSSGLTDLSSIIIAENIIPKKYCLIINTSSITFINSSYSDSSINSMTPISNSLLNAEIVTEIYTGSAVILLTNSNYYINTSQENAVKLNINPVIIDGCLQGNNFYVLDASNTISVFPLPSPPSTTQEISIATTGQGLCTAINYVNNGTTVLLESNKQYFTVSLGSQSLTISSTPIELVANYGSSYAITDFTGACMAISSGINLTNKYYTFMTLTNGNSYYCRTNPSTSSNDNSDINVVNLLTTEQSVIRPNVIRKFVSNGTIVLAYDGNNELYMFYNNVSAPTAIPLITKETVVVQTTPATTKGTEMVSGDVTTSARGNEVGFDDGTTVTEPTTETQEIKYYVREFYPLVEGIFVLLNNNSFIYLPNSISGSDGTPKVPAIMEIANDASVFSTFYSLMSDGTNLYLYNDDKVYVFNVSSNKFTEIKTNNVTIMPQTPLNVVERYVGNGCFMCKDVNGNYFYANSDSDSWTKVEFSDDKQYTIEKLISSPYSDFFACIVGNTVYVTNVTTSSASSTGISVTWVIVNGFLEYNCFEVFMVGKMLYALTYYNCLYVMNTNSGNTWCLVNTNLPDKFVSIVCENINQKYTPLENFDYYIQVYVVNGDNSGFEDILIISNNKLFVYNNNSEITINVDDNASLKYNPSYDVSNVSNSTFNTIIKIANSDLEINYTVTGSITFDKLVVFTLTSNASSSLKYETGTSVSLTTLMLYPSSFNITPINYDKVYGASVQLKDVMLTFGSANATINTTTSDTISYSSNNVIMTSSSGTLSYTPINPYAFAITVSPCKFELYKIGEFTINDVNCIMNIVTDENTEQKMINNIGSIDMKNLFLNIEGEGATKASIEVSDNVTSVNLSGTAINILNNIVLDVTPKIPTDSVPTILIESTIARLIGGTINISKTYEKDGLILSNLTDFSYDYDFAKNNVNSLIKYNAPNSDISDYIILNDGSKFTVILSQKFSKFMLSNNCNIISNFIDNNQIEFTEDIIPVRLDLSASNKYNSPLNNIIKSEEYTTNINKPMIKINNNSLSFISNKNLRLNHINNNCYYSSFNCSRSNVMDLIRVPQYTVKADINSLMNIDKELIPIIKGNMLISYLFLGDTIIDNASSKEIPIESIIPINFMNITTYVPFYDSLKLNICFGYFDNIDNVLNDMSNYNNIVFNILNTCDYDTSNNQTRIQVNRNVNLGKNGVYVYITSDKFQWPFSTNLSVLKYSYLE